MYPHNDRYQKEINELVNRTSNHMSIYPTPIYPFKKKMNYLIGIGMLLVSHLVNAKNHYGYIW